jgi:uncharacterized protein YggT (Ycf19 family)
MRHAVAIVYWAVWALQILVLLRVAATWIPAWNYSDWMRPIKSVVDPILRPLRSATLRAGTGGVDFSPLIVIIGLQVVQGFLRRWM